MIVRLFFDLEKLERGVSLDKGDGFASERWSQLKFSTLFLPHQSPDKSEEGQGRVEIGSANFL
jgi:hypothetical protein